jgi:hypothetical protein
MRAAGNPTAAFPPLFSELLVPGQAGQKIIFLASRARHRRFLQSFFNWRLQRNPCRLFEHDLLRGMPFGKGGYRKRFLSGFAALVAVSSTPKGAQSLDTTAVPGCAA